MTRHLALLALLLPLIITCKGQAEDSTPKVDNLWAKWELPKVGRVIPALIYDNETVSLKLSNDEMGMASLRIAVEDASKVAEALKKSDDYFKKQKDAGGEQSDTEKVGDIEVDFMTRKKDGFGIIIKSERGFTDMVMLKKQDAAPMSALLAGVKEKAELFEKKMKAAQE